MVSDSSMIQVDKEFTFDFFMKGPTDYTLVTFLMPNGLILVLNSCHNSTLAELKEELWYEASKKPLFGKLHDISVYVFVCINSVGVQEELLDETKRLCDVRPTGAVLKVTECTAAHTDNIDGLIGNLIGKRLSEFDALNNTEINDFRFKIKKLADEITENRSRLTWKERLYYEFPLRLAPFEFNAKESPSCQNGNIVITSKFENSDNSFTFNVPHTITPSKLLEIILTKKATIFKKGEHPEDYILKVCGSDEYLVGDYPITKFQYIQDALSREIVPTVVTMSVQNVPIQTNNHYEYVSKTNNKMPLRSAFSTLTLRRKGKQMISWDIEEEFCVELNSVSLLNCDTKKNYFEIVIQAGLFHGGKSLCQPQKTAEIMFTDTETCGGDLDQIALHFGIKVCNIPKDAKLCFVIFEVTKNMKSGRSRKIKEANTLSRDANKDTLSKDVSNKDIFGNPIAWANTSVFDFKRQFKCGAMTLYMWNYAEDLMNDDAFQSLGTVVSNPHTKFATALTLSFPNYYKEDPDQSIVYPSLETMIKFGYDTNEVVEEPVFSPEDLNDIEKWKEQLKGDAFYEMYDQDKKKAWSLKRYWLKNEPDFLPKLVHCIEWDDHKAVSQIVTLLQEWPILPVEKALELLDYAYADHEVRAFAVKCLENVSDEDLLLYLLQLVQALKHELYLYCDLVVFLLKRALSNQKIGHYLFWHLRSEMQVPSISTRFGLILEAYCRGSQEHMAVLSKQLSCLNKLKECSELTKPRRDKEKARGILLNCLNSESSAFPEGCIRSPLDPCYSCKRLRVDKCRIMDSKMRPLWVVFENSDSFGEDIYIIFKNGDDLRQDMLTLQMIRIMDKLWKQEGLDLRMNPYNCISMEYRVGMIEVVLNAETIANIQKEKGMFSATSAFRKGSLLAWLKDHNTSEAALKKAILQFTLSCAGYCVATYVLGVGDRHSDNIMVKRTGQLFHIDFGHILGHFKEKFGFKRERVPFVLTHDFVHVISKGQKNNIEFKVFQEYCEKAFLILRRHGGLFLSLCAMMISTGLPELSSEKDLNYLRETLVISKTEQEALAHFRSKFYEALSNSWKTSVNWATHNLSKNTKT